SAPSRSTSPRSSRSFGFLRPTRRTAACSRCSLTSTRPPDDGGPAPPRGFHSTRLVLLALADDDLDLGAARELLAGLRLLRDHASLLHLARERVRDLAEAAGMRRERALRRLEALALQLGHGAGLEELRLQALRRAHRDRARRLAGAGSAPAHEGRSLGCGR